MDCSLPGYSVHGILQARTLEWVTVSFSRGFFQPRDRTQVSSIAGRFFITELSERPTPPKKIKERKQVLASTRLGLGLSTGEDRWDHRDSKRQISY